jgi:hypothetical protein
MSDADGIVIEMRRERRNNILGFQVRYEQTQQHRRSVERKECVLGIELLYGVTRPLSGGAFRMYSVHCSAIFGGRAATKRVSGQAHFLIAEDPPTSLFSQQPNTAAFGFV